MLYLNMCLRVVCRIDLDVAWFLQAARNDAVLMMRLQQLVREEVDGEIFLLGILRNCMV